MLQRVDQRATFWINFQFNCQCSVDITAGVAKSIRFIIKCRFSVQFHVYTPHVLNRWNCREIDQFTSINFLCKIELQSIKAIQLFPERAWFKWWHPLCLLSIFMQINIQVVSFFSIQSYVPQSTDQCKIHIKFISIHCSILNWLDSSDDTHYTTNLLFHGDLNEYPQGFSQFRSESMVFEQL